MATAVLRVLGALARTCRATQELPALRRACGGDDGAPGQGIPELRRVKLGNTHHHGNSDSRMVRVGP